MTRLLKHVALISESAQVSAGDLMKVASALQKQATRDLAPIWDIGATVDAFGSIADMPLDYWPIIIRDDIGFNAAGIHLDKDGQPFALVSAEPGRDSWSLTCSHEMCEMLVDPFGNRLVAGQSIKPDQGRVNYLVEVCDPSEAASFAYAVNGVVVSDFYTPHYFDPVAAAGVRYSYTGAIPRPRMILEGGLCILGRSHHRQLVAANLVPRPGTGIRGTRQIVVEAFAALADRSQDRRVHCDGGRIRRRQRAPRRPARGIGRRGGGCPRRCAA